MSGDAIKKEPLLCIENLKASYGAVAVLKGVSLHVNEGEIVTLIGANGAGKSTLMMTIFGRPRANAGRIIFQGEDITALKMHEVAARGLALAPEGRHVFPRMSVFENLQMGARDSKSFKAGCDRVFALFPRLAERVKQRAGTLSGGEQQMLAIGRALINRPHLLLLDEPSLGLAPLIVKQIYEALGTLNKEEGLTIFLVEQNAFHALQLASRAYVLVNGEIHLEGPCEDLIGREDVRAAYLGVS